MIGSVFSLLIFVLIVWAIVSAARRFGGGDGGATDTAVSFRRLFIYLLLLAAVGITAIGAQQILEIVLDTGRTIAGDDSARQARGVAFLLVGAPSLFFLARHLQRRLEADPYEERSAGWRIYLNAALLVSLVVAMTTLSQVLRVVFGVDDYDPSALAWGLVAATVWLVHWFGPLHDHPLETGTHLAGGSLFGLAATATGVFLIVLAAGDAVYDALVGSTLAETDPIDRIWQAVSALAVGVPVWWWHWLRPSRREWNVSLWNGYVVVAGVLSGVLATVGSIFALVLGVAIWLFGEPDAAQAAEHFEFVPTAVATAAAGVLVWAYHAWIYKQVQAGRTEPVRIYEYTMAAVGLLAAAGGIATLIVAFIQAIGPAPVATGEGAANVLISAVSALVVGAPLWWTYWNRIERAYAADARAEAPAISRRIYTLGLFGVSAIVGFVALLVVAFIVFEDIFDGVFGGDTLLDARVGIALTMTAGLVTWYHFGVYRRDRDIAVELQPIGPKRITLVGMVTPDALDAMRDQLDGTIRMWERTDRDEPWQGDVTALVERIAAHGTDDVMVLLDSGMAEIVPVRVR